MMSAAVAIKIDDADLSTARIVTELCDAIRDDVGDSKFAEKTLANIAGCGLRTARNWLDTINAPDTFYTAKLIRSKHFPHFTAAWLRIAGIENTIDPRLAQAVSFLHQTFQQVSSVSAPSGSLVMDPSMVVRFDEPEGWNGE